MSLSLSFAQAEERRSWIDQVAENSARLARVGLYVQSTGAGEAMMLSPVSFGISFLDVPHFTTGYEVRSAPVPGHYPQATTFVTSWQLNEDKTLVIGAFVGFIIDDAEGVGLQHDVLHHLRFEGIAIKVMP